jgi:sec-independent protein translocase protein TatA
MVERQFADILGIGTFELIIILVILLLLFGGSKLPQLSRSIATSVKELRKGVQDDEPASEKKSSEKSKAE